MVDNDLRVQHSHPANCNHSYGTERKELHVCGCAEAQDSREFFKMINTQSFNEKVIIYRKQGLENRDVFMVLLFIVNILKKTHSCNTYAKYFFLLNHQKQ